MRSRYSTIQKPLVFWFCLYVAITPALLSSGCRRHTAGDGSDGQANGASILPPLVLRDDTKDLLLTWVDSAGDFHVVDSIAEVPAESRERVRVVVTTSEAGNADPIYVADLRQKNPDQSYQVSTLSRSAWEELGAAKRKARIESLAPITTPEPSAQQTASSANTSKLAIIYGAKWCGACREAKRYLAKKGVQVLEKDVDESATVQAELRNKLSKAGHPPTSSIPVIDIGGKILVGFSQVAVDTALQALQGK